MPDSGRPNWNRVATELRPGCGESCGLHCAKIASVVVNAVEKPLTLVRNKASTCNSNISTPFNLPALLWKDCPQFWTNCIVVGVKLPRAYSRSSTDRTPGVSPETWVRF